MKNNLKIVKIISVFTIFLVAMLINSCGGGDGGDGAQPPEGDSLIHPNAPSSLSCTVESCSQIDLSWLDNSDNEDGFIIERRKESESFSLIKTTTANTTSYSDRGLEFYTAYSYRVYAYNAVGNSSYSNLAFATTIFFTNFDCKNVKAIAIDSKGGKWFGTAHAGVSYLNDNGTPTNKDDDTWITFTTSDGLGHYQVNSIAIDSKGGKWFGTINSWLSYLNDNGTPTYKGDDHWITFTTSDGLAGNYVKAIAIDSTGGKWFGTHASYVGTGGGTSYLDDNGTPTNNQDDTWIEFVYSPSLFDRDVHTIAIDSTGGKWFGTGDGTWGRVSYLDDNGTPTNKEDDTWAGFNNYDVRAIAIDATGGKWIGTRGGGVSYLNDNGTPTNKEDDTLIKFTTSDGLAGNYVNAIAIDSTGGKWIGIDGGYVSYLE